MSFLNDQLCIATMGELPPGVPHCGNERKIQLKARPLLLPLLSATGGWMKDTNSYDLINRFRFC